MRIVCRTEFLDSNQDFDGDISLPYGPVQSVTSVAYVDGDDASQTVDAGDYTLDTQSGLSKIRITDDWPETNRSLNNVVVTYVAGYTSSDDVPETVKHAVKMTVARLYEHRGDEDTGSLSDAAMDLLDSVKVYWNAEY
jgi:uncharacterized phiE125 gp8 family phage protein